MASVPRPKVYFKLFSILILIGGCICFLGMYQLKKIVPALERLENINSTGAVLGTERISTLMEQAKAGALEYAKSPQGSTSLELRSQFSQIDEQLLSLNNEVLNNLASLSSQPDPHGLKRVAQLLAQIQYLQGTNNRIQIILLAIEDIAPLPQQQSKIKDLADKIPAPFKTAETPLRAISDTYKIMIKKEKQQLESRKIIAQKSIITGAPLGLIAFLLLVYRLGYVRAAAKRGNKTSVAKPKESAQNYPMIWMRVLHRTFL